MVVSAAHLSILKYPRLHALAAPAPAAQAVWIVWDLAQVPALLVRVVVRVRPAVQAL